MNAQRKTNLDELENAIEYKFKNIKLLGKNWFLVLSPKFLKLSKVNISWMNILINAIGCLIIETN